MPELKQKLSKVTSGYLPPEKGPFECGHCIYFVKSSSCQLVQGNIDAQGCCNLYVMKEENNGIQ